MITLAKFTQGKWSIVNDLKNKNDFCIYSDNTKICQLSNISNTSWANAKLIKSAPELLEALLIAHDIIVLRCGDRPELQKIKDIIKKAI